VPWMWTSVLLGLLSLVLLIVPGWRNNIKVLTWACVFVFVSIWIDKGMGLVVAGFVPSVLGYFHEYRPTAPELLISLAVWGIGTLVLTVLYKIALTVRQRA
jgi:Ni/Fe-hydrogenase subunit HybB-like protein